MTDSSRSRAAAALRDLAHVLVGHEADSGHLDELTRWADSFAERLRSQPDRARPADALLREIVGSPAPAHNDPIHHYADCPVSGRDNPFALPARAVRQGDEAVVQAVLGRAHEGAPGRAHGGVVAALFDDAFGFLAAIGEEPVYGGRLEVDYRRPTPLGRLVEVRCRFTEGEGRRRHAVGTMAHGPTIVAEAKAVLVVVPAETVGRATYPQGPL